MSDLPFPYIHTHFSRGGGPASPDDWCRQASGLGYKALAIVDRGPLAGVPAFVEAAKQYGLAPLCGAELDVLLPPECGRKAEPVSIPVLLFARDAIGMANLSSLCSIAYRDWPRSDVPVEWATLSKYAGNLAIVLLAAPDSGVPSALSELPLKKLNELGDVIRELFGSGAFVGLPGNSASTKKVATYLEQMGLPAVATPVARHIRAEDAPGYYALRSARAGAGWGGITEREAQDNDEYLRSQSELNAIYSTRPGAIENGAKLAEMCSGVADAALTRRPDSPEDAVESTVLAQLAEERLLLRLAANTLPADVAERLNAEAQAAVACGSGQAWLALGSLVEAAHSRRVPLGAPLGMADGALLSYALGVSSLNPMPYARPRWVREVGGTQCPPPPGVEVPLGKREMLVGALAKEYGWERVAHAACVVDITPVAAAQAVLAVLQTPGEIGKLLLAQAIEKGWTAFRPQVESGGDEQVVGALAASLEGAPIYFKPDPDTVVITPAPHRSNAAPVGGLSAPRISSDRPSEQSEHSEDTWIPWAEGTLCRLSFPALSLRPLRALTVLDNALALAGKYPVPGFIQSGLDPSVHPQLDDATTPPVTGLITKGEVLGIPVITSKAARGWKDGLTPESMAALVAHSLARHKIQNPKLAHEIAEGANALSLVGEWLYRDQADTLVEMGGLGPEEAATLRRSLLKPGIDADGALRTRLVEGCVGSGLPEDAAKALRDAFVATGHSTISRFAAHEWGRIALWSAVIKASHPAALFAGTLAVAWEGGVRSTVGSVTSEAVRLQINVLPPDASRSKTWPVLERDGANWAIIWGLALLPGWSKEAASRFINARSRNSMATLRELALVSAEAGLTLPQLESLVQSGACDTLGGLARDRSALFSALGPMLEWARANSATQASPDLFTASARQEPPIDEGLTLKGDEPSPRTRHTYRSWEEANLGVGFTEAPEIASLRQSLKVAGDLQSRLIPTTQVAAKHLGQSIYVVGILSGVRLLQQGDGGRQAREDMPVAVAQVEDMEGSIELIAFPPNYKRHRALWADSNIVIITARVSAHEDGSLYLLSEHIVPFEGNNSEEELSFKVKVGKSAARPGDVTKETTEPASARSALVQTQVVAVPKSTPAQTGAQPTPMYAQTAAQTNGNGNGNGNGHSAANGNDYSNGHGSGSPGSGEPSPAQPTGNPVYKIVISLPISEDDRTDIDTMLSLNDILAAHPGSDTVLLRIPYSLQPKAVTFAHLPRGARYSSHFEAKVSNLLGSGALEVTRLED